MEAEAKHNSTTVAFETLGCKLNQAETEFLTGQLREAGYTIVPAEEKADIYILNTCTVTHIADRKSRHFLRLAHHRNPFARIIALGCYAEGSPAELSSIEGVERVISNQEKSNLVQILSGIRPVEPGTALWKTLR